MRGTGKSTTDNTINPTSVKEKYEALRKVCEHLWIESRNLHEILIADKKNRLSFCAWQ